MDKRYTQKLLTTEYMVFDILQCQKWISRQDKKITIYFRPI